MAVLAMVLLGWCLLSLPVGLVAGRLLRGPRPQAQPDLGAAQPSPERVLPRHPAVA